MPSFCMSARALGVIAALAVALSPAIRAQTPAAPGSDGLKLGAVASARIAPVRGSITTTVPLSASAALTSADSAFSAAHWMSRSIVSRTELPSTGSRWP